MPKTKSVKPRRASTAEPEPQIRIRGDRLELGPLTITFQRTLRIPDDGSTYPLPPWLGAFPLRRVADYADTRPGGVAARTAACSCRCTSARRCGWGSAARGRSGRRAEGRGRQGLRLVGPHVVRASARRQRGRHAGLHGRSRSAVARRDQRGQRLDPPVRRDAARHGLHRRRARSPARRRHGGIQLCVFDPQPGFAVAPPPPLRFAAPAASAACALSAGALVPPPACAAPRVKRPRVAAKGAAMGLAAGGRMRQRIYPDPHGLDAWDQDRLHARLRCTRQQRAVAGRSPASTPRRPPSARRPTRSTASPGSSSTTSTRATSSPPRSSGRSRASRSRTPSMASTCRTTATSRSRPATSSVCRPRRRPQRSPTGSGSSNALRGEVSRRR